MGGTPGFLCLRHSHQQHSRGSLLAHCAGHTCSSGLSVPPTASLTSELLPVGTSVLDSPRSQEGGSPPLQAALSITGGLSAAPAPQPLRPVLGIRLSIRLS